jgi:uncharacterized protein (TIGR03435 family)
MLRVLVSRISKVVIWNAILCGSWSLYQSISGKPETPGAEKSTYTPHMAFDVASIRESGAGNMSSIDNDPKSSFYYAQRVAPWGLILNAYDLHIVNLLKNVPAWAMDTRFDVMAKSDPSTDEALAKLSDSDFNAEKRHMLQSLLVERFKLQIHPETKVSTIYELVTTPRAAKLMTPVQGDLSKTVSTCSRHYSKKGMEVESTGCPFPFILSAIRQELGTNVLDHTGLSGAYAYHLMWSPSSMSLQDDEERYPDIVNAVREQLGLELKESKGPVTFWVVDHIERPIPN